MSTLSRRTFSSCESFAPISGWQLAKKLEMISIRCCLFVAANLQIFWKRNWYGFDLGLGSYPPPEVTKMDCCWFTVLGFSSYMWTIWEIRHLPHSVNFQFFNSMRSCVVWTSMCNNSILLSIYYSIFIQPYLAHHKNVSYIWLSCSSRQRDSPDG